MITHLDIVSFDVPYPANYGGVIDVFYKIKALHERNVSITLHCFQYGNRLPAQLLERYCEQVFYYPRKTGITGISPSKPYIVNSRKSESLLKRLQEAPGAILFEGLHTCNYLDHPSLSSKIKVVRCANVEHEYYKHLAQQASFPRSLYYNLDSQLLKKYETVLEHAQLLLTISSNDQSHFEKQYPKTQVALIPAFHGQQISKHEASDELFALFHGSLNVIENERAVFELLELWHDLDHKLKITGRLPSNRLVSKIEKAPNVELIANPSETKLSELISAAQIHMMLATQATGLKLKLLNVLFNGKHVIANNEMLTENSLRPLVHVANNKLEIQKAVDQLMTTDFTDQDFNSRKSILTKYSDENSVNLLLHHLNSL
ncbi:glycosyltransferase family 1 protein [Nonlabens ponticola]|uniref:Glycosyltransferase family 1 protein n=1 Tax=Nonlabens ponticola TaxID=2496866 RepID=A0A3S9MWT8_9FLAO|nr:glycosyltransferase family 1 protein [Nonlabens ponticola]AZQ43685.1 glycosyltransferase family 1 protein [Nonlabens ponticola]